MSKSKIVMKKIRSVEWQRKQLINKYGGICAECGERVNLIHDHPKQATIDHIVPLSKGGSDNIDNLQPLCSKCNRLKGDNIDE